MYTLHVHTHAHMQSPLLALGLARIWWVIWPLLQAKLLSHRAFPTPTPSQARVSPVSDFYVEYFILVILFFVLSLALKKSRARIGMTFVRRRKSFPSACVFRSCDIPYILATVLEVRQCFVRIKASLTVAAWVLKRPLKDEKTANYMSLNWIPSKPSLKESHLLGVWGGTGREGRSLEWGMELPKHKKQFLLWKSDVCFPG